MKDIDHAMNDIDHAFRAGSDIFEELPPGPSPDRMRRFIACLSVSPPWPRDEMLGMARAMAEHSGHPAACPSLSCRRRARCLAEGLGGEDHPCRALWTVEQHDRLIGSFASITLGWLRMKELAGMAAALLGLPPEPDASVPDPFAHSSRAGAGAGRAAAATPDRSGPGVNGSTGSEAGKPGGRGFRGKPRRHKTL